MGRGRGHDPQLLSECGEINSVRFATDRETGDFKGFGHVSFADSSSTDKAVAKAGEYDLVGQVITQCWAVGTTIAWTGVVSAVLFLALKYTIGLRPDVEAETNGLDISEHGERAYN